MFIEQRMNITLHGLYAYNHYNKLKELKSVCIEAFLLTAQSYLMMLQCQEVSERLGYIVNILEFQKILLNFELIKNLLK
mgnify:CR=1 FL=1